MVRAKGGGPLLAVQAPGLSAWAWACRGGAGTRAEEVGPAGRSMASVRPSLYRSLAYSTIPHPPARPRACHCATVPWFTHMPLPRGTTEGQRAPGCLADGSALVTPGSTPCLPACCRTPPDLDFALTTLAAVKPSACYTPQPQRRRMEGGKCRVREWVSREGSKGRPLRGAQTGARRKQGQHQPREGRGRAGAPACQRQGQLGRAGGGEKRAEQREQGRRG